MATAETVGSVGRPWLALPFSNFHSLAGSNRMTHRPVSHQNNVQPSGGVRHQDKKRALSISHTSFK